MNLVLCPYCNQPAKLVTGREIKPHRKDLWSRRFWNCTPCRASVSAHKDGWAMGRLAKGHVSYARMQAHLAFDALWQNPRAAGYKIDNAMGYYAAQKRMRLHCYLWLADVLMMTVEEAHISMMLDVPLLQAVREMALAADPADIRARYPIVRTVSLTTRRRGRVA